jgi:hypothetical protein
VAVFEQGIWRGDAHPRELRLPDGQYESVSLWELEMAKTICRARGGRQALHTQSWLIHLLEARELIEQRQTEQKAIRRKVQQLREHTRGRPRHTDINGVNEPDVPALLSTNSPGADDSMMDPRNTIFDSLSEVL